MSQELINYYAEAIDKDMNSSHQIFNSKIMELASQAEAQKDEESRQTIIMNDMMYVFEEIASEDRNNPAYMKFKNIDWDKLTGWQLKQIQNVCREFCPIVNKSCETILVEGC